jgi:hypothetical protein
LAINDAKNIIQTLRKELDQHKINFKMVKILDCTLRDGGYYTNWDFNKTVVDQYIQSTNKLPLEYLEIGYRSIPMKGYLGKYFYSPIYELERLRNDSNKKFFITFSKFLASLPGTPYHCLTAPKCE